MEGEAGQVCRAACVAGAWRPRGVRALTRPGAGAGERTATRRQAGPVYAAGPKRRRRPSKVKNVIFQIIFYFDFIQCKF